MLDKVTFNILVVALFSYCVVLTRLLTRMEQYIETQPPPFELITENVYLDDTGSSRDKKKAKKMVCECQFDPGVLFE